MKTNAKGLYITLYENSKSCTINYWEAIQHKNINYYALNRKTTLIGNTVYDCVTTI